ncbi:MULTISPECIES: hypothetical protein [Pantoea]|nr:MULTISPECIES: hypothetical protein [Pantoea]MCH9299356.1 hypothetical protein [Pantoea allii]NQS84521.1 hypothetical protein [Pantoea allii]
MSCQRRFTHYANPVVDKTKPLTRVTPLLKDSLMADVISAEKQKFISKQAKRGSGSLRDRNGRTVCSDLWEKDRESPVL